MEEKLYLMDFSPGAGCGCKLGAKLLQEILEDFPLVEVEWAKERLLASYREKEDCAVYKLDEGRALLFTVDFFTPIVQSPRLLGEIALSNALSDIYAMGGEPILGLSLLSFPTDKLPKEVAKEILLGAREKAKEAHLLLAGGHSIEDGSPKIGFAISGIAHPDALWFLNGAKEGDLLILTKPIGTGVFTTALKEKVLKEEDMEEVIKSMQKLNRVAKDLALSLEDKVHAACDVTGFSLLGHLYQMLLQSKKSAKIYKEKIPTFEGVERFLQEGYIPGGTKKNLSYIEDKVEWGDTTQEEKYLLCDPQTSGGLLFSIEKDALEEFTRKFQEKKEPFWVIGEVIPSREKYIYLE